FCAGGFFGGGLFSSYNFTPSLETSKYHNVAPKKPKKKKKKKTIKKKKKKIKKIKKRNKK
ncbi:hypothetical protein ACJBX0_10015, partial [Streptococcus suis]